MTIVTGNEEGLLSSVEFRVRTTLELAKATPSRRKKVPVEREYVGIDLHRRRSVIVRKNAAGELLSKTHIDNDPIALIDGGGGGRSGAGGGDRGDVRLVLGGRIC